MPRHSVRGRIGRQRGGRQPLRHRYRSQPVPIPPVPWIGQIQRYLYPTQIADDLALSSDGWDTGNFYDTLATHTGSVVWSGLQQECYYYVLSVPNVETDTLSVILQPLRYTVDEPAAAADDFDYFLENASHRSVLNTLLPISGDSHISDGKPTELFVAPNMQYGAGTDGSQMYSKHVWDLHGGWNPLTISQNRITRDLMPKLWAIKPRYGRLFLNGVLVDSLIDFDDWDQVTTYAPTTTFWLRFPSNPATFGGFPVVWELDFTAGDELTIDVWYEFACTPPAVNPGTGQRYVIGCIPRHAVSNSARSNAPLVTIGGLKVNFGFDPSLHTYSFNVGTSDWYPGDGASGAQKARNIATAIGSTASYVGIGTAASGTGDITPGLPTGWAAGDDFWLICETANETITAPTGWSAVTNSPQGTGTAGSADATAMSVFRRRATASESAPTIADPGNHCIAQIVATRGGPATGNPWDVTAGSVEATNVDPGVMPSVTTTVGSELMLLCAAYYQNLNLVPPLRFATFTNAGLTGITVRSDTTYNVGNGGGLGIATATKTTAGSTGTTSVSWNQSSTPVAGKHAFLTIAVRNVDAENGWTVTIDSRRLWWSGLINGGVRDGKYCAFLLDWSQETVTLKVWLSQSTNPLGPYLFYQEYRPDTSGDYIEAVTDRAEGDLENIPSGVFNGLGSTTFVPYYGVQDSGYTPPTPHAAMPASIVVIKVNQ